MGDLTIAEFCDAHGACRDGREWALAHCATMNDVWATIKPEWLIWIATRPGVLNDRELRSFTVWSARQVQHLMSDPRSIAALDVAERHARGEATDDELAAAPAAARAAWAAYRAAWAAARAAAPAAARAAWAAARAAARDAQAAWLRAHTTPRFTRRDEG